MINLLVQVYSTFAIVQITMIDLTIPFAKMSSL